jgi:F-type H+-transporting ATPase subunit delta
MKVGPVSARYAGALFELARDSGVLDKVQADVDLIASELATRKLDARTPHEVAGKRVEELAKRMHPLTANFVRLLRDKKRLEVLDELPAAFRRCVLVHNNSVEGVVESARPLGSGELAELSVSIGALLGKQVMLSPRIVPELLAGVRVYVDNKLIDQSALGRLDALRGKLLRARLATH